MIGKEERINCAKEIIVRKEIVAKIPLIFLPNNSATGCFAGNSSKITGHIFRIFDSDGNDFLDFKEFLMAVDIANRETGKLEEVPVIQVRGSVLQYLLPTEFQD